jgi:hypothetical protein
MQEHLEEQSLLHNLLRIIKIFNSINSISYRSLFGMKLSDNYLFRRRMGQEGERGLPRIAFMIEQSGFGMRQANSGYEDLLLAS